MILHAVAEDLTTPQNLQQQAAKSKGHARVQLGAPHTAAETHALVRASQGFTI